MTWDGFVRRAGGASLIAATAAVLLAPAGASAAVTIGSNLASGAGSGYNCNNSQQCTVRQATLLPASTAAGGLTSPVNGTVIGFRVNNGGSTVPLQLRVIRPSGAAFVGAGTSAAVAPPANQISPLLPVSMPIKIGDSIGLECCMSGQNSVVRTVGGTSNTMDTWGTLLTNQPLPDGGAPLAPDTMNSNAELMLNADVEPDNGVTIGKAQLKKRKKVAITATVPNAGTLTIEPPELPRKKCKAPKCGPKAKSTSLQISAPGTVTLVAKLTKAVKRAARLNGKFRFSVPVGFLPQFGQAGYTQTSKLTLKG